MARSGKTGRQLALLLSLLAILGGVGGWNAKRNLEAERSEVRPFGGYADADLATLAEAYRAEIDAASARAKRVNGASAGSLQGGAAIDQRVADFERVQAFSRAKRSANTALMDSQVTLEQIEKEQQRRSSAGQGFERILRLATTFP